jgi:aspartate-semialdehyde dehydrogenase
MKEPLKILNDDSILITATAVRIPTAGGHSEAINIEFEKEYDIKDVTTILNETPGVIVSDNPAKNIYPMPIHAKGKDEVFVGRIRRDESQKNTLNMWVVADNLRKGAATNTIQIAEYLIAKNLV